MPIYEYRCQDCGHEFEELVRYSEADQVKCEKCGSKRTERLASGFCSNAGHGSSAASTAPACGFSG